MSNASWNCYLHNIIFLSRYFLIMKLCNKVYSMYKLIELLNTHNKSELCMLSKYVTEAVKLRNSIIY